MIQKSASIKFKAQRYGHYSKQNIMRLNKAPFPFGKRAF